MSISIKSPEEIALMATSCAIVSEIMSELRMLVQPGITTKSLDEAAAALMKKHKVTSNFKGYHGYPATICTSVNEEVVHVIPSSRVLQDGDVLSIDAGVIYQGFHSDMAITVPVGSITKMAEKLIDVTRKALYVGIDMARIGNRVGEISYAIEQFVKPYGFGVVRELVGHGIGREMHEEPPVPNYGPREGGALLKEGMAIAIEPMITLGKPEVDIDGWRVTTTDRSLAAHFEHTVAITKDGPRILTELKSI